MSFAKLQIGCLLIVLYLLGVYIHESLAKHVPCKRLFDALLALCPWAIVFDGVTAWTVNCADAVPAWVNLALHGAFYLTMDAVIVIAFAYMVDVTVGMPRRPERRAALLAPGALSLAAIVALLPQTYYVAGRTTWYSMGPSVIVCYGSLLVHCLLIVGLVVVRRRTIERRKFAGVLGCALVALTALAVQAVWPETLISALFPTFLLLGLYINIEDPTIWQLRRFNATMVTGFSTLVENRDGSTGGHILRTQGYVGVMLDAMRGQRRYARFLTRDYVDNVRNAAPLHDVGKIATPDRILQKPGRLDPDEYAVMREHAARGGDIVRKTFSDIEDEEYRQIAYDMARHHHEKWDGSGYPDGLAGEQIPLHARIMAIADVFDAVSAKRCYRDALPLDECFAIIECGAGTDFDPDLARLFLAERPRVERLCAQGAGA